MSPNNKYCTHPKSIIDAKLRTFFTHKKTNFYAPLNFFFSLQMDFSDGLNIIALIEVLSHKKLPRHNRKPMFRSQKLENVSVALDFLENVERIKLVNIDSTHMVDGKLKLILGLIWTLILHYSITMPQWEFDNRGGEDKSKKV